MFFTFHTTVKYELVDKNAKPHLLWYYIWGWGIMRMQWALEDKWKQKKKIWEYSGFPLCGLKYWKLCHQEIYFNSLLSASCNIGGGVKETKLLTGCSLQPKKSGQRGPSS